MTGYDRLLGGPTHQATAFGGGVLTNFMKNNKYYIITIGCQMNKSDSERLAGHLESQGLKPAKTEKQAGLVAVNTCGVRQSAEDRVYGLIPRIKKENPKVKIVLTGCLSEREDVRRRLKDKVDVWLPIKKIGNWKLEIGNSGSEIITKNYLNIKPRHKSKFSAYVSIGNGCDNFCSYCVVPYARGREVYRSAEDILLEVKNLVKKGYKEIILIAQNVNSYKIKSKKLKVKSVNFAKLLKMINGIPGDFWIRFATSHPKDMSDELIKAIAECEKVCRHVHLPAQAGDDGILKSMNRKYTRENYVQLVGKIRKIPKLQIPNYKLQINPRLQIQNSKHWSPSIAITTDIIVGFPGETRAQFANTKKLFKEIKFDMAYIAQYSPRPGTAAENLEDNVSKLEKKRREEELMKILRKTALENNKKYVGQVVRVLVEGLNKKGELFGKTETGKNVKVRVEDIGYRGESLVCEFVDVKIVRVRDFGLEGVALKSTN
ncbi:tRNA (N6-isopentenyl adenosine(37)-C2)-methylthiotransferase MiaB [Candidatus Falkowbacteria bacterium CG11_big_fil_rev_8_21_14_0_20_39_10]|uniref:tRNA-2-methylthio-N(6)-dimethylallyladenosine synthase n=1 Tax=Candidatus Falkowbacteria bacterium CG11_big_fil_rev_8_21_14_0_20_39_10 TaxID=1974570 RepID=A0A2M6KAA8_9BACT|nr:MAG: tRNA (N6-isopentenyl adenosine(37)-C2)-methylthiotransferase MiaB [Candidatus Falkowbacteria bacterium CG11_big_fil_rev_8_21_14_0_20_39_10]